MTSRLFGLRLCCSSLRRLCPSQFTGAVLTASRRTESIANAVIPPASVYEETACWFLTQETDELSTLPAMPPA